MAMAVSLPDKQFVDIFPGHDVVDVLSFDCYGAFQQSFYDDLNALSEGKVMAISAPGNVIRIKKYSLSCRFVHVTA